MTSPGPLGLTRQTADKTESQSELRTGVVATVTSRGISVFISGGNIDAAHLDSYSPAVGDTVALMKAQDSWLALGRVVGSGTPTNFASSGSAAGPTILAAMRTAGTAALVSSTGSSVFVPKYSLTYFHPVGHEVLIMAAFSWNSTVSTDWILADLTEVVSGTGVGELTEAQINPAFGRVHTVYGLVRDTFGGAKRQINLTMARLTGTGTTTVSQFDVRPGYMIALDLGDKSVIVPT
jgi:hypothetical protein